MASLDYDVQCSLGWFAAAGTRITTVFGDSCVLVKRPRLNLWPIPGL